MTSLDFGFLDSLTPAVPVRFDTVGGGLVGDRPRSKDWPRLAKDHLKRFPECAACGRRSDLQVHHVKPFHLFPDLELDPFNLLTGCPPCHFVLYHVNDWAAWVPDVRELAHQHRLLVQIIRGK